MPDSSSPTEPSASLAATAAAEVPGASVPSRRLVLAASAPWLGALLNTIPGLGAGYLYQRRWLAWWLTNGFAAGWLAFGAGWADGAEVNALQQGMPAFPARVLVGLSLLSLGSAAEAFLAARRARME